MGQFTGLLGVAVLIGLGWAMSSNRRAVPWRLVGTGILLQVVLAVLMLRVPGFTDLFDLLGAFFNGLIARADAGIEFVFGRELGSAGGPVGFVFAVRALPVIIFFASLMAVLYYVGLMQRLIAGLAWLLRRTLGVTGTEALAMAANVFVGQTEAPLTVKPVIERMTRAQLMTLMVGGFATVAGSVLAVYVSMLGGESDELRAAFAKHLLTASVLSAPAAFVMSSLLVPETESPPEESATELRQQDESELTNVLEAAAAGATDGLRLALNVGAMLIAFVALLAVINWPLEAVSNIEVVASWRAEHDIPVITLEVLLGWLFAPLAWTMGVPWDEADTVGSLMGVKLVLTELIAYERLGAMTAMTPDGIEAGGTVISTRTAQIAAYALCGFANFASIAIQIGGLSAIAPGRRKEFSELAFRAMIGGAMASWMTASVAGLFL